MNKKQLLSIAMLLSVVAVNANPLAGMMKPTSSSDVPALSGFSIDRAAQVSNAEQWAAQPTLPLETSKVGMFGQAWNTTKEATSKGYTSSINTAKSGIAFAQANSTTAAVRTGAGLGLGYVAYRQSGNVATWIKENPVKSVGIVALAAAGYYKGDVALTAAKGLVAQLPERFDFVNTGLGYVSTAGNTVSSYLPSMSIPTIVKDNAVTSWIANNPKTASAYGITTAQAISDFVGLGQEEQVEETPVEEPVIGTDRHGNMLGLHQTDLTTRDGFRALELQEQIVVVKEFINWLNSEDGKQFQGSLYIKAAYKLLGELTA